MYVLIHIYVCMYVYVYTTYFTPKAPAHVPEITKSVRCMRAAEAYTHSHSHTQMYIYIYIYIL